MNFLAGLVSDNFRSLEKIELGHCAPAALRKKLHGVLVLLYSYLRVRFGLPISINFRDINGVPKVWPRNPIRGHPRGSKVVPLDSVDMISY